MTHEDRAFDTHGVEICVSDEERREVARRLRSFVTDDSVYADVDACRVLHSIGFYYKDIDRIYFSGFDVARLADLIEPRCDCDALLTLAEEMRHSTKEEIDAYEAMLEKQSVELHPVDRDALLALADELEEDARWEVQTPDDTNGAWRLKDTCDRIREACEYGGLAGVS